VRRARGLFVAGTDTGVGKTFVSVGLIQGLVAVGHRVAAMKPIAAGCEQTPAGLRNDDARALMSVANVAAPYERVNPYALPLAASPHLAAREAGVVIDLRTIRLQFDLLAAEADAIVVEGAGGWLAPITDTETMADVAHALELPVLLVVGVRLGCLNHALLSAQAIAAGGAHLLGWIANCTDPMMPLRDANIATLAQRWGQDPLAVVAPQIAFARRSGALGADWLKASRALDHALTLYLTENRISP